MTGRLDKMEDQALQQAGLWCVRLAEGRMSDDEQLDFEAWLDERGNRVAFEDTVRTWRTLDAASLAPEVLTLRRGALEKFRRTKAWRWRSVPGARVGWAAAVASVAILVGLGGLWASALPKAYETGVGERRVVRLADGSKVSLDAATRVKVRFTGRARRLELLQGRAKFDVVHDASRPFSVAAADKTVVATGTQFSVETLRGKIHVILYEGRVLVTSADGPGGAERPVRLSTGAVADRSLLPGREMVAVIERPTAVVSTTDPNRSLSWEAGQLVFVDEPLADAVQRVNRYSTQKLEVGDVRAARMLVNGVYSAGDTAAFVEGTTGVLSLEARSEGGRTLLTAR